jgi:hypothetical protein
MVYASLVYVWRYYIVIRIKFRTHILLRATIVTLIKNYINAKHTIEQTFESRTWTPYGILPFGELWQQLEFRDIEHRAILRILQYHRIWMFHWAEVGRPENRNVKSDESGISSNWYILCVSISTTDLKLADRQWTFSADFKVLDRWYNLHKLLYQAL